MSFLGLFGSPIFQNEGGGDAREEVMGSLKSEFILRCVFFSGYHVNLAIIIDISCVKVDILVREWN